jgi:Flp pilus assembly protein TadG
MTTIAPEPIRSRAPHTARWRSDAGSGGTSLAFILLMPAVLLLLFGGIQFGLHNYARSLAVAAAQAGARAATAAPASTQRGQDAAEDFLTHQAATTLTAGTVTVQQDGATIPVTVSADAPSLVPLTHPRVVGQAAAVIERLP